MVNNDNQCFQDGRFLPGGGAAEIELARQISSFADTRPGLDQYPIKRFAYALEIIPKTLADNSGVNSNEAITKLYASHEAGKKNFGLDLEVWQTIFFLFLSFLSIWGFFLLD